MIRFLHLFSRHTRDAHNCFKLTSSKHPNLPIHVTLDGNSPHQIQPPPYKNYFKNILCLWGGGVRPNPTNPWIRPWSKAQYVVNVLAPSAADDHDFNGLTNKHPNKMPSVPGVSLEIWRRWVKTWFWWTRVRQLGQGQSCWWDVRAICPRR